MAKIRKEVSLDESVVSLLQVGADKKDWSLKKYMEYILFRDAKKWFPYAPDSVIKKIPTKK